VLTQTLRHELSSQFAMPRVADSQTRASLCSLDPCRASDTEAGSGQRFATQAAVPSPTAESVPVAREYENVRIKGQGLADELHSTNETIRKTIKRMSSDLHPTLEVCACGLVHAYCRALLPALEV
jgi:hypothetical protein